ncbi:MAG: outer membrane beta-barrel protein [Pseudomonadota bacterium]
MIRSLVTFFAVLAAGAPAYAFDVVNEKLSYSDSKFVTLSTGLGFCGFSRQTGVSGNAGFGVRVAVGHHFNQYLLAEIAYQYSLFHLTSPDPVAPGTSFRSEGSMNQEALRFELSYPAVLLQPFLSFGIGGYNLYGIDETGLSFPTNFEVPLGAGIRAYTLKNRMSVDVEYNYQFLIGVNQPPDTLRLLGLGKVGFNTYSLMASITFHWL